MCFSEFNAMRFQAVKLVATLVMLIALTAPASASVNTRAKQLPRFEDYRVRGAKQKSGQIIGIDRPQWTPEESKSRFNSRVRHAAREGANFAGRYAIVGWSCGFICLNLEIVDVQTGKILDTPFGSIGDSPCPKGFHAAGLLMVEFRLDSRLLILRGTDERGEEDGKPCGTRYYVLRRNRLVLIREVMTD